MQIHVSILKRAMNVDDNVYRVLPELMSSELAPAGACIARSIDRFSLSYPTTVGCMICLVSNPRARADSVNFLRACLYDSEK
jgi:hypothetical protein